MKPTKKTPESRTLRPLRLAVKKLKVRERNLLSTTETLALECADLKMLNAGIVAQNIEYKTKIAEWELAAGIGVEDVWKRLKNDLWNKMKAETDRHVASVRRAARRRR